MLIFKKKILLLDTRKSQLFLIHMTILVLFFFFKVLGQDTVLHRMGCVSHLSSKIFQVFCRINFHKSHVNIEEVSYYNVA